MKKSQDFLFPFFACLSLIAAIIAFVFKIDWLAKSAGITFLASEAYYAVLLAILGPYSEARKVFSRRPKIYKVILKNLILYGGLVCLFVTNINVKEIFYNGFSFTITILFALHIIWIIHGQAKELFPKRRGYAT